jgi:hypothetical protein
MKSAMNGCTQTAKLLVEMKADITARNTCDDISLLHTSAFCPAQFLHRSEGTTAIGFALFSAKEFRRDTAAMVAYLRSIGVPE